MGTTGFPSSALAQKWAQLLGGRLAPSCLKIFFILLSFECAACDIHICVCMRCLSMRAWPRLVMRFENWTDSKRLQIPQPMKTATFSICQSNLLAPPQASSLSRKSYEQLEQWDAFHFWFPWTTICILIICNKVLLLHFQPRYPVPSTPNHWAVP